MILNYLILKIEIQSKYEIYLTCLNAYFKYLCYFTEILIILYIFIVLYIRIFKYIYIDIKNIIHYNLNNIQ
jgi:hypothetical protein